MSNFAKQLNNRFFEEPPKVPESVSTLTELHEHIENEYEQRRRRPKVDETHQRVTFLLDKRLNERLNKICNAKDRGFKTLAFNRCVEALLREYE